MVYITFIPHEIQQVLLCLSFVCQDPWLRVLLTHQEREKLIWKKLALTCLQCRIHNCIDHQSASVCLQFLMFFFLWKSDLHLVSLMPLENSFFFSYSDTECVEDQCIFNGPIRTFPHFPGNWAMHVFIPCECHLSWDLPLYLNLVNDYIKPKITKVGWVTKSPIEFQ